MDPKKVAQIIKDNDCLKNIGGHYFEGTTYHPRKIGGVAQMLPQMNDLIPFENEGAIKRIYRHTETGHKYVAAFVKNEKTANPGRVSGGPKNDWHKNTDTKNGNDYQYCIACFNQFVGHKTSHICRKCHYISKALRDAITPN